MSAFDPALVERQLRGLCGPELAALVADLWAARGYETTRDGSSVVATRDGESVRICVVGDHRWRPWRQHPIDEDAAVVVSADTGVTAPGADVVDAADLADVLAYGVERTTARELCVRHLGARPGRLSPSPLERPVQRAGAATRRGTPVAAVGILLLGVVLAATGGFALVGSPDPAGASTDSPVTPVSPATEPPPLPPAGDGAPPGVGDDGITDLDALAAAHTAAVGERSHTIWYDRSQPRDLDPNKTRVQDDIDLTAEDGRYLVLKSEVDADNETYLGGVYRGDGVIYTANWNETADRHDQVLRVDRRNVLVPTPYDLRENLVERYLSTPTTNVTGTTRRDEVTVYRVVGRGAPDSPQFRDARNYSVVALVDSRGLVHDVTVHYTEVLSDRSYQVTVEVTYGRIGDTTVDPPLWFEQRNRSTQDPSGANRPL